VKVLQFLNAKADVDKNHLIRMHDFFFYKERLIIATELLDENLYTLGQRLSDNNLPKYFILPRLKLVTKQILEALVCVHELNIIHCDIKPENVLIKSHGECSIKLIDFGSSCFCGDVQMTYIQSRSYRAPDVILGHRYDGRIDVWSLAAMVAELHTGSVLFQNESIQGMLARIHAILGPIPQDVLSRCEIAHKYYTKFGVVYHEEDEDCSLIYPILTDLRTRLKFNVTAEQKHGRSKMREKMIEKTGKDGVYNVEDVVHNKDETYGEDGLTMDERLYIDFVRHMLTLDPLLRPTAKEALQHPWLADTDKIDLSKINESTPWR
jgi:serine/threonine protein kinase